MNKSKYPNVIALILTYNDADIVLSCIKSVQGSDYSNLSIYLIDNGSNNNVVDRVKKEIPDLNIIALPKNIGFSGGFNSAMKQLYRNYDGVVDYFWIINNDLEVAKDTLSGLINVIEENNDIGFIGPETFKRSGNGEHDQWITRRQHPKNPADILLYSEFDCNSLKKLEVEFVVGHCMLVRTNMVKSVGMMRQFFIYWDELEWQWRAKKQGWKCYVVPGSRAYHDRHSFGKPGNTYLRTRNCIFFNRIVLKNDNSFRCYFQQNILKEIKGAIVMSLKRKWTFWHSVNFVKGLIHGFLKPIPKIDYL